MALLSVEGVQAQNLSTKTRRSIFVFLFCFVVKLLEFKKIFVKTMAEPELNLHVKAIPEEEGEFYFPNYCIIIYYNI